MEVVVRNLPESMTERQIRQFFTPYLADVQINTFRCSKFKKGGGAILTIFDQNAGTRFLKLHGQSIPSKAGFHHVCKKLWHQGRPINCMKSVNAIDPLVLRSLEFEEEKRLASLVAKKPKEKLQRLRREYDIGAISCGQWCYDSEKLIFASYYKGFVNATMRFGRRSLLIKIAGGLVTQQQMDIPYSSVVSFTIGRSKELTATMQLTEAPRFYEEVTQDEVEAAGQALQALQLGHKGSNFDQRTPKRKRITALGKMHSTVAATCLCYRFHLTNLEDYMNLQSLKRDPNIPTGDTWTAPLIGQKPLSEQLSQITQALASQPYSQFLFRLKFAVQQLAQNGYLRPSKVKKLLKIITEHRNRATEEVVAKALQRLMQSIPYGGPQTDPEDFNLERLSDKLQASIDAIERDEAYSKPQIKTYEEIAPIYKALVTPVGIYLSGPEPEVKNRVLRTYSNYTDYFLSVNFADEDGEPLRGYDRFADNDELFHGRFKNVLQGIIPIAGRSYQFLGFSHSSLRTQTCWFMAPFIKDGTLVAASLVIKNLGDFSAIRSPAKCAARIGQAFSQAFSSVEIQESDLKAKSDVERNGRTFSDGVGTVSFSLLQKIWAKYAESKKLKPTVLQIRFAGAKGMIALDSRVKGDALYLRPSMVKFPGSPSLNIEICGAGFKPLPMYLNRQLIKILEDLGVNPEAFMKLQTKAVDDLRRITESPVNASSFLRRSKIGVAAKLPYLVRELWQHGFSYVDEDFLRNIVELATLIELREIKHRSRIKVENGVTLYGKALIRAARATAAVVSPCEVFQPADASLGIMDETGILAEGQIHCTMHNDSGPFILTGDVIVTRCPALHPGDVQIVEAVDVPADSPLRALHNCIIFSQYGERDLPSQLSGGDLDGDLYNVIYDDTLFPTRTVEPAAYPAVQPEDIGREVERSDMAEFFIKFMQNDSLGRIATLHMTLADTSTLGTFDPDCLVLADLHSSAVDFSKSGVPADLRKMPKYPPVRPDFQAPGPRLLVDNTIELRDDGTREEDDENEVRDEYAPPRIRYYKSHKALGKLYRAIDEEEFLVQLQNPTNAAPRASRRSLNESVWKYVEEKTALIQWQHWYQFALDTRDSYEENLVDTMFAYSPHAPYFISEVEVFSGSIIGRNGAQNKRQRETSVSMKDKHERDVEYTVRCIRQGEEEGEQDQALERSIACLYVGCNVPAQRKRVGELVSFAWVAASVCLREVKKFLKD